MKLALTSALFIALAFFTNPASSQVVDISGPWFIDFPQGRGTIILEKKEAKGTGGHPKYVGWVTIPHPKYKNGMRLNVGLLSHPSYVVPGKNISFNVKYGFKVRFFLMNVSSSSSGVAWIMPGRTADAHIRTFYNLQAPIHR